MHITHGVVAFFGYSRLRNRLKVMGVESQRIIDCRFVYIYIYISLQSIIYIYIYIFIPLILLWTFEMKS